MESMNIGQLINSSEWMNGSGYQFVEIVFWYTGQWFDSNNFICWFDSTSFLLGKEEFMSAISLLFINETTARQSQTGDKPFF